MLPQRRDALHGPRVVLVVDKERVKVKRVSLVGNAPNDDHGTCAPGPLAAHRKRERRHRVDHLLRRGQLTPRLKAKAVHAAGGVVVGGERAGESKA